MSTNSTYEYLQNVRDRARYAINATGIVSALTAATTIAEAVDPFFKKPSPWTLGTSMIRLLKAAADDSEVWAETFFELNWKVMYSSDFGPTIQWALRDQPRELLRATNDNGNVTIVTIDGVKFAWIQGAKQYLGHELCTSVYTETKNADRAHDIMSNILWAKFEGRPIVMKLNSVMTIGNDENHVTFSIDDGFNPLPSAKATEYTSYLRRCLDAGVHRSVMLYGPPGTGKSTMACTLVNNLGLRSLRIRVNDVDDETTLRHAVSIFKPDAIVLDDFDRASRPSYILEMLENFRRNVKLVVATVNELSKFDPAVLRPGRFDELVPVERMDEGVVRSVLGNNVDGFEVVKDWPVAFIQEYVLRRRFMTPEEASRTMFELSQRVVEMNGSSGRSFDGWDSLGCSTLQPDGDPDGDDSGTSRSRIVSAASNIAKKRIGLLRSRPPKGWKPLRGSRHGR